MLRYTTDRARPGLVALYDIRPGNGAGQFLQPQSPHGATGGNVFYCTSSRWGILTLTLALTEDGIKELPPAASGIRHTTGAGGAGGVTLYTVMDILHQASRR